MTESEVFDKLTEIFRDVFDNENINLRPETTADDIPEWDSFQQVFLIVAVQEKFAVKLHSREIDHLACVGDLVRAIAGKSGDKSTDAKIKQ